MMDWIQLILLIWIAFILTWQALSDYFADISTPVTDTTSVKPASLIVEEGEVVHFSEIEINPNDESVEEREYRIEQRSRGVR